MPRNSNEQPLVAAIDPRVTLRNDLDSNTITLRNRLHTLEMTRKQLDLEILAVEESIQVAETGITSLEKALAAARELATIESLEDLIPGLT